MWVLKAKFHLALDIEEDEDGYFARCPELQGCYTPGETLPELIDNSADAIKLHLEDRLAETEAG